jgi:hypothetical protein
MSAATTRMLSGHLAAGFPERLGLGKRARETLINCGAEPALSDQRRAGVEWAVACETTCISSMLSPQEYLIEGFLELSADTS